MMMAEVFVLVDYDNVAIARPERTALDVETNLSGIAAGIAELVATLSEKPGDVRLRLYGGWRSEKGEYSQRAQWILSRLSLARGTFSGLRLLPELAESTIVCSSTVLMGTLRRGRDRNEQKMVDTMIAVDALHLAALLQLVIVASDDDDMVPAAIAACQNAGKLHLARRRSAGRGINDAACARHGVTFLKLPPTHFPQDNERPPI